MGFMKFGKKEKINELDGLDIPPPPPLDAMSAPQMPQAPFPTPKGGMALPPQQGFRDMPMPGTFPPPKAAFPQKQDMIFGNQDTSGQSMSSLPDDIPLFQKKVPDINEPARPSESFENLFKPSSIEQKSEAPDEARQTQFKSLGQSIFIEVTSYKQILKDLSIVKKSLTDADAQINALVGDINDEEKMFSSLHSTLSDVEEKLGKLEGSIFTK
jgi:hypothetical protein